jgi:hypothetical protein
VTAPSGTASVDATITSSSGGNTDSAYFDDFVIGDN